MIQVAEKFECEFKYLEAAEKYLDIADESLEYSKKINYFTRAAKCFELAQPWK